MLVVIMLLLRLFYLSSTSPVFSFWCIVLVSRPFDESVTGIAFANLTTNSFGITLEEEVEVDYDDDDEEQAIQPPT